MTPESIEFLQHFIPILESGALRDAHTAYITTGEYAPPVRDLQTCLKQSGIGSESYDWLSLVEEVRPFLQEPEKILTADDGMVYKLVSLATFSEKLNKSFFPHLCSSGFMLNLLKRMQVTH